MTWYLLRLGSFPHRVPHFKKLSESQLTSEESQEYLVIIAYNKSIERLK